jgi:putative transposase
MKKLSKRALWKIVANLRRGLSVYQTSRQANVSARWIRFIWKTYLASGDPPYPKPCGRKQKRLSASEEKILIGLVKQHPLGAVRLELILRKQGVNISHNLIHRFMKENNLALDEPRKQEKRKWVRYERHHSNSLWHVDWTQLPDDRQLIVYEDDASRFITGFGVFKHATLANSLLVFQKAVADYGAPKQLLSDNGTQFRFSEAFDRDSTVKNKFQKFMESQGVHQVFTRVHRPQANGKIERLFCTLKRHMRHFGSIEASIEYYNLRRPHMSLRMEELETPYQAYLRKRKKTRN